MTVGMILKQIAGLTIGAVAGTAVGQVVQDKVMEWFGDVEPMTPSDIVFEFAKKDQEPEVKEEEAE